MEEHNVKPDNTKDNVEFENPSVDPGFESGDSDELKGREDERDGNIDASKNISEMQKDNKNQENDALNYKNDRENGAYNPKNI